MRNEGSDNAMPMFNVPTSTPSNRGLTCAICLYTFPNCFGERMGIEIGKMGDFQKSAVFHVGVKVKYGVYLGIHSPFHSSHSLAGNHFITIHT